MYVPPSFAETNPEKLHDFIEVHSFATVVSSGQGIPIASHVPLLLDRDAGEYGELIGHMARANPQWKGLDGTQVLAIFHGPHAYISSSWYETTNAVPTWNYVALHAYGRCEVIDNRKSLLDIVRRYLEFYEGSPAHDDDEFINGILNGIVGFKVKIERLEGKWKLSQNHSVDRRRSVIRSLNDRGGEACREIAELMVDTLE